MIDSKEFAEVVFGLAANFGVKIPDGLLEIWHDTFKADGISLEQIRFAAGKIIRSKKDGYGRMPTYAEFIEIIQGGNKEDKALVIANEIIVHLRTYGSRVCPKLDSIAKHLMIKRWPYPEWSSMVLEDELKWWTKEFCEAYNAYSARDVPLKIEASQDVKKLVNSIG